MWQIVVEMWQENPFFVMMVIGLITLALTGGKDDLSRQGNFMNIYRVWCGLLDNNMGACCYKVPEDLHLYYLKDRSLGFVNYYYMYIIQVDE